MSRFCVGHGHDGRYQFSISRAGCWAVIVWALCSSAPAFAQSAADKATARQLATQGIQYYQQGKSSEALDLLQKAQQLYDAPVHLIYIGRAQAALNKYVEASETFRRLIRTDLPAGAPQAFKDAVSDAHKELQTLEPKIPSLRINVTPADAAGLHLTLDGESLSAVVIGINRPTNPGKHTVEVSATGYDTATASLDLASGGKQTVALHMKPTPGAVVPPSEPNAQTGADTHANAVQGATTPAGTDPTNGAAKGELPDEPFDKGSQIVIGVRGNSSIPMGTLRLGGTDAQSIALNGADDGGNANTDAATNNRFGIGSGIHLHVGYRLGLGKRFALTPSFAYEGNWFATGDYYNQGIGSVVQNYLFAAGVGSSSSVLQMSRRGHSLLLGAAIEFPMPSDAWAPSYYAEVAFIVYDRLSADGKLTTGTSVCNITDKFIGNGLKFGAGIIIPASRFLRLAAGVGYSAVSTSARDYSDDCPRSDGTTGLAQKTDFSGSDRKVHSLVTLGLGGDFQIGL